MAGQVFGERSGAFGRLEVVAEGSGRRRWSAEAKGRLVAESHAADGSVSSFARSRGLAPSQLFAWRKEARSGALSSPIEDGSEFAALMIEGGGDEASIAGRAVVEIVVGEVTLRLPEAVSARRVGELVAAVIAASRGLA